MGPHRRTIGKSDPSALRMAVELNSDEVWVVVDSCDSAIVGDLVEAPVQEQWKHGLAKFGDDVVRVRKVARKDTEKIVEEVKKATEEDDLRIIPVLWDRQGARERSWETVIDFASQGAFHDWPASGPQIAMWPMRHISKRGGSPTTFLARLGIELMFCGSDRNHRELELLLTIFELAGAVYQLNLGNLVWVEIVCRRMKLIMDVVSGGGCADGWMGSEHYLGLGKASRGVCPTLTAHVAARFKDGAEVDKQRSKAKESIKLQANTSATPQ